MTIKTLSFVLSLVIMNTAFAAEPAEPVELVKLRTIYDNSLRGEFQKVGKLYHGRLVELKKNYMEAQNLEAAVAVDTEIKKLRETHGKMVVKVPEPQEASSPLDGIWICSYSKKMLAYTIKGDKIMDAGGGIGKVTRENGIILVEWGKWWHKMTPSPDNPDVMTGTNPHKVKLTYTRFKW